MKKRYYLLPAVFACSALSWTHCPTTEATTLGFGSTSQHCLPANTPIVAYTMLCQRHGDRQAHTLGRSLNVLNPPGECGIGKSEID